MIALSGFTVNSQRISAFALNGIRQVNLQFLLMILIALLILVDGVAFQKRSGSGSRAGAGKSPSCFRSPGFKILPRKCR